MLVNIRVGAIAAIRLYYEIDTATNCLVVLEIDGGRALFPRRTCVGDSVELVDTVLVRYGVGEVRLGHVLLDFVLWLVGQSLNGGVTTQLRRESKVLIVIIADSVVGIQQFSNGPFRRGNEGICVFVVVIPVELLGVFHSVDLREMG